MADKKQETIADVVRKIRNEISELRKVSPNVRSIAADWWEARADEIEAAHKRELSKNTSKNGADFGQLGDAAKLREALITIRDKAHEQYVNDYGIDTVWIQDVANAALAAPARNCDKYATVKEATEAFAREQDMPHPCPDFTFSRWLLTPVKKEGGAK